VNMSSDIARRMVVFGNRALARRLIALPEPELLRVRFRFPHRHTLPVGLGCVRCSFQLGRTSIFLPRLPHLAQTTRLGGPVAEMPTPLLQRVRSGNL
jgi:hypothetical protein